MESYPIANSSSLTDAKQVVADYWENEACGEKNVIDQEMVRYFREPEFLRVADFPAGK